MYYIYLDDIRNPTTPKPWDVVRNFQEFQQAIVYWAYVRSPLYISFDHDLSESEPTGYDAMKWFCEYLLEKKISQPEITINVHSANPVGKKNIEAYWENFRKVYEV